MRKTTLVAYLAAPALMTLVGLGLALTREPISVEMLWAVVVEAFLFYAAPYLLWLFISAMVQFSLPVRHAGLIGCSITLVSLAVLPLIFGGDPSGLPMHWLLYWPMAAVLAVTGAIATAVYTRLRGSA